MEYYVEIAIGGPRNRGSLVPVDKLSDYIGDGKNPLYRSLYLYDESAMELATSKGSVKEYPGIRYPDDIIIDIDKGDSSDEHTLNVFKGVIMDLEEIGLTSDNMRPYFSGTGYHLKIHKDVFNFSAAVELPLCVKATIQALLPSSDCSIYMRTGIYRVAHTINQKTGRYKIPLTFGEVKHKTAEEIIALSTEQRLEFPYEEMVGNGELEEYIITHAGTLMQTTDKRKVREPSQIVPCVQSLFNQGPMPGKRHKTVLRLASHFRRNGFPSHIAKAAILHWNDNSLDEASVRKTVEQTYNGGYQYGCSDELLEPNCKTKCIYFKNKDYTIDVLSSADMQKELATRLETDFSGKCLHLSDMLGLDESIDATIYPGELVTIFGPTGSSKTTFAQNLVLGYDFVNDTINPKWHIPTLFLSLELSAWYMQRRHLQIVSGQTKDTINKSYKYIYMHHEKDLAHIQVQTIQPTIESIQAKIRELQPAVVVVDYIDLVQTPKHIRGEYEQIKYISHNLSNMAVNNDCIIIQISQVSREYSRNEALDLYAGKGSGAIENASRKVIGLNGQAKDTKKAVQLYKNTDGELFKVNLEWTPSFRLIKREDDDEAV